MTPTERRRPKLADVGTARAAGKPLNIEAGMNAAVVSREYLDDTEAIIGNNRNEVAALEDRASGGRAARKASTQSG